MQEYAQYQQKLIEHTFHAPHLPSTPVDVLLRWVHLLLPTTWWPQSFYAMKRKAELLARQGESHAALMMLIPVLKKARFWRNHTQKWWHLMREAVRLAQQLELTVNPNQSVPIHELRNLCLHAPQPWQGTDSAYCFSTLSLCDFEQGRINRAITLAKLAAHADVSWGYPEYLLGWYGLYFEGIDSVSHFTKAIKHNWDFFKRIKEDPLCQKFPNIFQEVKSTLKSPILPLARDIRAR